MADKKISELEKAVVPLKGDELLVVVQNRITKNVTVKELSRIGSEPTTETHRRVIRQGTVLEIKQETQFLIHGEFTNMGTINIAGPSPDLPGYSTHGELVILNGCLYNEGVINNEGMISV